MPALVIKQVLLSKVFTITSKSRQNIQRFLNRDSHDVLVFSTSAGAVGGCASPTFGCEEL
eukprot:333851-Amphidinium_carterae.1